jgi:lipid II:glycine glycyltransferase (peptidoglycan interpeptide bridge formation enzyme)
MTSSEISIEVDSVNRKTWTEILGQFDDACIEQTWSFATAAASKGLVSHLIIRQGAEIAAACQIQLRRIPVANLCVADVRWGPLVQRRGVDSSFMLPRMIRALKDEYGIKRGCYLRISPHVIGQRKNEMKRLLADEGFYEDQSERPYRTLMLDLSPSLDELRSNFLQRWRRHLNKAEKSNLVITEGTTKNLFHIFLQLAAEMQERKNLHFNYEQYGRIQEDLPELHKMKIFVCEHAGTPLAVTIGSAVGNTGIYLLGATGQSGLEFDASYLAHWRLIQWLKSMGARYYDLGAINPQLNPGGYFFKQGIAGKHGWDETFLHRHHGCFSLRGRLAKAVMKCLQAARRTR